MESHSAFVTLPITTEIQLPHLVSGGKRASYYAVIALILLATWLFRSRKHSTKIEVPFYNASKTKWIFDAETLIKDSYAKVK
jgi:hypothetical protein